jgi:hypothetical protein
MAVTGRCYALLETNIMARTEQNFPISMTATDTNAL